MQSTAVFADRFLEKKNLSTAIKKYSFIKTKGGLMKKFIGLITCMILLTSIYSTAQQQYNDVVYLKNGGKVIGVIVEQIPNVSIKIEMTNGSVMIFKMDEIEKITKEKVSPPAQQTQEIQQPQKIEVKSPIPSTQFEGSQMQNTTVLEFQQAGTYGSLSAGAHSVKALKTTTKIDGSEVKESDYKPYTGFILKAQVVFQGTDKLAFLVGGTVDKYAGGTITSYYIGGHLYFSQARVSPFLFVKGGYGFGSIEDPISKDKVRFTGPYFTGGLGTKIYIEGTWGLYGEVGYKYQGTTAEWNMDYSGHKYKLERTQNIGGVQFLAGFFFYP